MREFFLAFFILISTVLWAYSAPPVTGVVNSTDPGVYAVSTTPANGTTIVATRGLYIGGAGNVAVRMAKDSSGVTFYGITAGTVLPVRVDKVYSTDTSATYIVGLY